MQIGGVSDRGLADDWKSNIHFLCVVLRVPLGGIALAAQAI